MYRIRFIKDMLLGIDKQVIDAYNKGDQHTAEKHLLEIDNDSRLVIEQLKNLKRIAKKL